MSYNALSILTWYIYIYILTLYIQLDLKGIELHRIRYLKWKIYHSSYIFKSDMASSHFFQFYSPPCKACHTGLLGRSQWCFTQDQAHLSVEFYQKKTDILIKSMRQSEVLCGIIYIKHIRLCSSTVPIHTILQTVSSGTIENN